jgi:hypothetical protein
MIQTWPLLAPSVSLFAAYYTAAQAKPKKEAEAGGKPPVRSWLIWGFGPGARIDSDEWWSYTITQ